jgi:hypothetical protein
MLTFAAQVSTLKEYRWNGEQKLTVQHVHVGDGGQAVVGNFNTPAEGRGARKNRRSHHPPCFTAFLLPLRAPAPGTAPLRIDFAWHRNARYLSRQESTHCGRSANGSALPTITPIALQHADRFGVDLCAILHDA